MRWRTPLLFLAILVPMALAGCTSEPDPTPLDLGEDEAYVVIHVKTPLGVAQHPVWTMKVVPRLIAFLGDNETRDDLGGAGHVAPAEGWSGWDADNATTEFPESAQKDWLQPSSIWFEGVIPAGSYTTIRIEIIDLQVTDASGRSMDVVIMGDRLSIGPAEGDVFEVEAGKKQHFVFESSFTETSEGRYMIR